VTSQNDAVSVRTDQTKAKPVSKIKLAYTPTLSKSISVCYPKVNRGYAPIFKDHLDPRKSKAEQLASELSERDNMSERRHFKKLAAVPENTSSDSED